MKGSEKRQRRKLLAVALEGGEGEGTLINLTIQSSGRETSLSTVPPSRDVVVMKRGET